MKKTMSAKKKPKSEKKKVRKTFPSKKSYKNLGELLMDMEDNSPFFGP